MVEESGLSEVLTFTRDRVVESFLWAVGVAYEPQYGSLRKWLTKAILLVLIIDDVYDIYGSKHELHQFTTAIERWDPKEIQQLPEAMKRCFWVLYDTINNMDHEIQKEKGCNSVLPHLKKVWTGFCKALFVEAKWYHSGQSPSLSEYLDNGWMSSSGPLLSLHILIGIGHDIAQTIDIFNNSKEIVRHSSLIIRLCNDQGTSKAELERGDAHSSILCHMREANVTEAAARDHIKNLVTDSWEKINGLFISAPRSQQPMIRYVVNTARVASFIYQNGDGFGVQDRETRDQVLSCLIEPVPLA
ncbi:UNVERIFIED_CONTAM: Alpha-farnesene synthase [Sesamum latifolium]|uniref:Alpha-farnesene synthase n=1 Tax=Sesamum latifolium TaxID=2727402 RepID=A0AAW2WNB1_9LAMI